MKYSLKLIDWHDAYTGNHAWARLNELPETIPIHLVSTLGFEIARDEKHVTLCMSIGPEEAEDERSVMNLMTIPIGMIVREQTFRRRG